MSALTAKPLAPDTRTPFALPRVRPTAFGAMVLALVVITLFMASNYSNNLLYLVVYLWLALMLTSGLRTLLQFRSVYGLAWQCEELFAKTANPCHLRLAHLHFIGQLFLKGNRGLAAQQRCTWQARPTAAGWQTLTPPPLCAIDPLQFWCFSKPVKPLAQQLVLPCPDAHQVLDDYLQQSQRQVTEPEDITGFHDYQAGDDFRHIDWRASARAGKFISREWQGSQPSAVYWLDWHDLTSLTSEQRQETLTAWILDLYAAGDDWGLRLPTLTLAPCSDSTSQPNLSAWQHRNRCLQALAVLS